jgi:hypothetical protein
LKIVAVTIEVDLVIEGVFLIAVTLVDAGGTTVAHFFATELEIGSKKGVTRGGHQVNAVAPQVLPGRRVGIVAVGLVDTETHSTLDVKRLRTEFESGQFRRSQLSFGPAGPHRLR